MYFQSKSLLSSCLTFHLFFYKLEPALLLFKVFRTIPDSILAANLFSSQICSVQYIHNVANSLICAGFIEVRVTEAETNYLSYSSPT